MTARADQLPGCGRRRDQAPARRHPCRDMAPVFSSCRRLSGKNVARIEQVFSGAVERTGRWVPPRRSELEVTWCDVTLDFTEAVIAQGTPRIDVVMAGKSLTPVTAPASRSMPTACPWSTASSNNVPPGHPRTPRPRRAWNRPAGRPTARWWCGPAPDVRAVAAAQVRTRTLRPDPAPPRLFRRGRTPRRHRQSRRTPGASAWAEARAPVSSPTGPTPRCGRTSTAARAPGPRRWSAGASPSTCPGRRTSPVVPEHVRQVRTADRTGPAPWRPDDSRFRALDIAPFTVPDGSGQDKSA